MALGDWTGPDRDHDYFESRASEERPLGDREGIRPPRRQDPAAATRECRWHGTVDDDHYCRRPDESAEETTARYLGEIRDV